MIERGTFNKNGRQYPTICLNAEEREFKKRFQFGVEKARMIVAAIDEIRAFVLAHPKPEPRRAPPVQESAGSPGVALHLRLTLESNVWHCEELGEPRRARIVALFGTAKIATPYTASVPVAEVKSRLLVLNPGAVIDIAA